MIKAIFILMMFTIHKWHLFWHEYGEEHEVGKIRRSVSAHLSFISVVIDALLRSNSIESKKRSECYLLLICCNILTYVYASLNVGSDRERREDPNNSITLVTSWADLFCLRVEDVPVNVKSFFDWCKMLDNLFKVL